jgi:hypothetical protein
MYVVQTDDAWSVWRPYDKAHRPDGWNSGQIGDRTGWYDRPDSGQGTDFFVMHSLLRVL